MGTHVGVNSWLRALLLSLAGMLFGACADPAPRASGTKPARGPVTAVPGVPLATVAIARGDAVRGRELVQRFECNRCHEGTGLGSAPLAKNCFSCHEQISRGNFPVAAAALARFQAHVASAREAPSLLALGSRLEERWLVEYLLAPRDLRPKLTPTMPRLPIEPAQAADIAAYLTVNRTSRVPPTAGPGSASRGRELIDQKGCIGCQAFSGVPPFAALEAPPAGSD